MITSAEKASKFVIDFSPSFMQLFCKYFRLRLSHNCLSQSLEHIHISEYNKPFMFGDWS